MDLRKHQEECIESIEENFLENKKGLIKMFCGSCKSFVILIRCSNGKLQLYTDSFQIKLEIVF